MKMTTASFSISWCLLLSLFALSDSDVHAQEAPSLAWSSFDEALEQAQRENRPTLFYVHAPWCGPCLRLEREVFPDVHPLLERFALATLDYDDHDTRLRLGNQTRSPFGWAHHFGVDAPPGFVLLAPDGTLIAQTTGYLDATALSLLLAYAATKAYRHASFEDYVEQVQPGHHTQMRQ